ncbi:MAG: hypothetical protein U0625_00020 [Phycisphaerales bacterium]
MAYTSITRTDSGTCETRERTSALVAICLAALLALGTVIAAALIRAPEGELASGAGRDTTAGLGGGSGGGIGSGRGGGSGLSGDGPGAGEVGEGRGASGTGTDRVPKGNPDGSAVAAADQKGTSLVAGTTREAPKWGFTTPDKDQPLDPPTGSSPLGANNGNAGEGRSGAGGGGRATFMGIRADAKKIVYVVDFTQSMDQDGRIEGAKRELMRSINGLPADGSFAVVIFSKQDDTSIQMPPEGQLIPATAEHKKAAAAWIAKQNTLDGSTTPSHAMRRALELQPEAIFFLTDGGFYSLDAQRMFEAVEQLNAKHAIVIHTIALHTEDGAYDLKRLADQNGGTYRYVPPPGQVAPATTP